MIAVSLPEPLDTLVETLAPVDGPLPSKAVEEWGRLQLAAVLVVLFPRSESIQLILTERRETLTHHPGQISLPGGRVEAGETPWEAALRETREEIGIDTEGLQPVGRLDVVPTAASNHLIVPFVAWSPSEPDVRPCSDEVGSVIEVDLRALIDPSSVREETWDLRLGPHIVTFYAFGDHQVWGATGRILSDLAEHLSPATSGHPFPPGWVRPPG